MRMEVKVTSTHLKESQTFSNNYNYCINMKKIVFLVSLMCATMAMAAPSITATSQIDLSTAGQTDKYVRFVLSSSFSNGFDNTWDTPAANESGIYVYYNNARYTGWASNEYSENLPLGFYSCENTAYTLKFSSFTGTSYEIYDRVEDYTITVNGSTADYNFTIDESEKNMAINDRFVINYNPAAYVTLTTNEYGWASYSYSSNLVLAYPAGLKIYTGEYDGAETLDLVEVNYVKANEGVIVYGTPNTTYYLAVGGSGAAYGTNHLHPSTEWTTSAQNVFILKGNALYEYVGSAFPENKAYLQLPGGPSAAPKRISFRFNGTTDIDEVQSDEVQCTKFIENGQLLIKRGNAVYNLKGQMVR